MANELVKTSEELNKIADLMIDEAKRDGGKAVARYTQVTHDSVDFVDGRMVSSQGSQGNINKELIDCPGIYTTTRAAWLTPQNFREICVSRDLQPFRFQFPPKGIALPLEEAVFDSSLPGNVEMYDKELRQFTKDYPNTFLTRNFSVEQSVVVNGAGGRMIQTIPFFSISFSHGYAPIPTSRSISAVCATDQDIKKFQGLIKYLSDPTPDTRIKNAGSFSEAFHNLVGVSGLKYGTLEDAGIPLSELYDVVVLTGVPIHEIFGHHFEEPLRFLEFGESGTFKAGQNITNKSIVLKDDPTQKINELGVLGFSNFDAYGRRRLPRVHIQNGKVVEFLGSEYADNTDKLKQYLNLDRSSFVGNAVQSIDGSFPQPRMSCTVFDGPASKKDLEGKILLVPHEGHTRATDKTYLLMSFECYVVKNGEPQRVIPLQVTGGINQALANIELLDDMNYQTGMCGKSDPINNSHDSRVPSSQISRSQIWRGQQVYPLPISDRHLKILSRGYNG